HVFACNVRVKTVVYDWHNNGNGNNLQYHVKFVGAFVLTCYNKGTGNVSRQLISTTCGIPLSDIPQNASNTQIYGYFTTMVDEGATGFTMDPTPIIGPVALVQ